MVDSHRGLQLGIQKFGLKWTARIRVYSFQVSFGSFDEEIDAAHAYDAGAYAVHGRLVAFLFKPSSLILLPLGQSAYSECVLMPFTKQH